MQDNPEEKLLISKISRNQRELSYDNSKHIHILKVFMKDTKNLGIACNICGTEIELGYNPFYDEQDRIYFCPTQNIFMHKQCLISKHHPVLTLNDNEHSDFNVEVEFVKLK